MSPTATSRKGPLLSRRDAGHIRRALKHIPAERLAISSDCGMSRRRAYYKIVTLVVQPK
jgi:methionine synthase II (cobalamin-independent)